MNIRTRKLLGTIALLVLVAVWSLMGMAVAQTPWLANSGLRKPSSMSWPASAGCCRRCRSSVGWRGRTHSWKSGSVRGAALGGNSAPDRITRMARSERRRPSQAIRGSASRSVRPSVSNDAGDRRNSTDEARLLRHRHMWRSQRCAIAERIGEMPDVAMERGLRHRPAHRHFPRRVGILQVRQIPDSSPSRFRSSPCGSAASFRQIIPVHRGLARQRREVDRITRAEILDRERAIRRRQRTHPAREEKRRADISRMWSDIETLLLAIHHEADAALARDHLLEREPPRLAEAVRKRRRHVDGEGNAMFRQHRIGRRDQILVGAVECQADKPSRLGAASPPFGTPRRWRRCRISSVSAPGSSDREIRA